MPRQGAAIGGAKREGEDATDTRALYEAKVAAELAAADGEAPGVQWVQWVEWSGIVLARVMLVKGLPGPAEQSGGAALAGADGDACGSALEALGFDPRDVFATLTRPTGEAGETQVARRIRMQVEAVDPHLVLALDSVAAEDIAHAYAVPRPGFGDAVVVNGREVVAVDGLERSLADPARKRRVWRQMRAARPAPPVW